MVVDSDMDQFPAGALAAAIAGAAPSDAVVNAAETTEFFDIEMDDPAGPVALVARVGFLRLEAGEPAEATAFENARDASFGDAEFGAGCGVHDAIARRRRLWLGGFGLAMKGALRIDHANHPLLP
jgi:hypothetical protein